MDSTDGKLSDRSLYDTLSGIPPISFIRKFNKIPSVYPAACATVLYAVFIIWLTCFHEFWFDEAQAWVIAKNASITDILFKIPHYETPPPLWQFLLSIPAKAGLPFVPTMKAVQTVFAVTMVAVFEFRSPLPNVIKAILPFSYWMAYQYGIISRPYALLAAILFMCASLYMERDRRPVLYCILLGILCMTSLYGMVIASMIAAAWLLSLIMKHKGGFFKEFFITGKRRLASVAGLLAAGLLILALSWPKSDDASSLFSSLDAAMLGSSLLKAFLTLPSETFFTTDVLPNVPFSSFDVEKMDLVHMALRSVLIYAVILVLPARRKRLTDAILPLAAFMVFAGAYSLNHHFGLFFVLAVYCVWIGFYDGEKKDEDKRDPAAGFVTAVMAYLLVLPLVWTVVSARAEILYQYDYGKDLASWITENNVGDYKWLSAWEPVNLTYSANNVCLTTSAYLGKPLNYNLHDGLPYTFRDTSAPEAAEKEIGEWKKQGAPDFIIAYSRSRFEPDLEALGVTGNYELVCVKEGGIIDRGRYVKSVIGVWMNKDNKKLPPVKTQTEVPEGFVLED